MLTQITWGKELGGKTRRRIHLFPMTHIWERLRSYRWVVVQSFVRELEAFGQGISGDLTAIATGGDGLRAVEIAHAVSHHTDNTGVQI